MKQKNNNRKPGNSKQRQETFNTRPRHRARGLKYTN